MKKSLCRVFLVAMFIVLTFLTVSAIKNVVKVERVNAESVAVEAVEADGESTKTDSGNSVKGKKAIGASIAIGLTAGAGAIGMGIAIAKASEGISRQPEADGKIRSSLMLGLVFIETAIIYALIVAILIIFVL
mgnify:CR=1 FL=1